MAVDVAKAITSVVPATDNPLALLRSSSSLRLYVVHHDEAHYVLKLIRLEDQKVRWPLAACNAADGAGAGPV